MNVPKVTIFRIDIQNGINQPAIRTFHCNKTIPVGRIRSYRNRIRAIFTNFHRVAITVVFRYKPEESKYDEKHEQMNVDVKYCDVKSSYT